MHRYLALVAAFATAFVAAISTASSSDSSGFFVGFADDLPTTQTGTAAVTPARQLGATAFRFTLQWAPGTAALSATDAARLDRGVAAASGMRIVLTVYGSAGTSAPVDAAARDEYCGYVKDALTRYPAIRDVVIWNEPNKRLFWNPQDNVPALYQALLARCYDVLHGAIPNVNVIGLALSSTGNDDAASTSPGGFIRRVGDAFRASGRTAPILDTVGFHPYVRTPGERPWAKHVGSTTIGQGDWNKLMYNLWLAFNGTAQPLPGSGAKLWYLEDGFQTAVPAAKAGAYSGTETVTSVIPDWVGGEAESPAPAETSAAPDQGTQALDSIRLAACQPHVGAFFNFLIADEPILGGWQSGALWADLSPKGSFPAFQQAIAAATSGSVDCGALKGGRPSADFMPPAAPTALAGQTATAPLRVTLTWAATTDDSGGAVTYRVYRNGAWVGTTTDTTWSTTNVAEGTTYNFTVRGIDAASNLGNASNAASVTTPDATAPTAPADLAAQALAGPARVQLTWTASSDNVGVTAYEVSRDGVVLGQTATSPYVDSTVTGNRTYSYAVVALDRAGNRSAASSVSVTTPDLAPPTAVTSLAAVAADGPPRVSLSWRAATDDVGVTGYEVYRGDVLVTTTATTSATDTAVAAAQSYTYSVKARDAVGNVGPAVSVSVTVPDRTAPSVPTGLRASTLSRPVRVQLAWNASSDNVRVTAYRIYRNGALLGSCGSTSCIDSGVSPSTTYRYTVAGVDASGNASAQSASVTVTTPRK